MVFNNSILEHKSYCLCINLEQCQHFNFYFCKPDLPHTVCLHELRAIYSLGMSIWYYQNIREKGQPSESLWFSF